MSFDTKKNTITVDDVTYDVERSPDRGGGGEETLTIKDFSVEQDDWIFPFPGLEATLGYEEGGDGFANPRDWSNVGTMACHYPGYDLGDDVDPRDFIDNEVECNQCEGVGHTGEDEIKCELCEGSGYLTQSITEWVRKEYGARVIIPLFVYEHSGITMSAGSAVFTHADASDPDFNRRNRHPFDAAGWDTSSVGVIFDTPEKVQECIGDNATDEQIEKAMRSEVEVYASYLEGDVTWYSVQDEETGFEDACGGFVGSHEECERQCFDSLESAIVKRLAEESERSYWLDRGVETI